MVFYSERAKQDLNDIFNGLILWKRIILSRSHALEYHRSILNECNRLDKTIYHARCTYQQHKQYGRYVHHFRKSKHTTWYIIYNKDKFNNIFIQHLVSNHLTSDENAE
ncbi:MAG: hypothetical protein RIS29_1593 [Bacteroidota bacterium]